jgi:predicted DCC family thiol-disulfide oxidoreductase YuxK
MNTVPVMLYDGDCAFCQRWIEKWRRITGERVRYEPFQKALVDFPQLTAEQCRTAVQLILPEGQVFSGAHAVLKALALGGRYGRLLRTYECSSSFGKISEWSYQLVAGHRSFISKFYHSPQCRR